MKKKSQNEDNESNEDKANNNEKKEVEKKENTKDQNEIDLESEIENLKEEKLRLLADMENLRKRFEKEKIDTARYGSTNLARDILSLGDNLTRALDVAPKEDERLEPIKNLIDGLKMVQKEFIAVLEKHGVTKISALEKEFDHNLHQAMLEVETDDFEEGIVVKEIQSGYKMHERLLRPSMVGVSKKPENKKKKVW